LPSINHFIYCVMENYPLFELKAKLKEIEKRLSEDVIVDLRWQKDIKEDKEKVKQLKRSIAILESNKY
jgi:hypothetical protein